MEVGIMYLRVQDPWLKLGAEKALIAEGFGRDDACDLVLSFTIGQRGMFRSFADCWSDVSTQSLGIGSKLMLSSRFYADHYVFLQCFFTGDGNRCFGWALRNQFTI